MNQHSGGRVMKIKVCLIALFFGIGLFSFVQADTPMQSFTSPGGGFTISTPGNPKESVQTVDSAAGPLELHQFLVEDGNNAYIVMYNDYPKVPSDQEVFFNNVRDGGANAVKGKVTKEKVISRQGFPGRAFHIETADTVSLQGDS